MHGLRSVDAQYDLFGEVESKREYQPIADLTAGLEKKYGPFVLHSAESLNAITRHSYIGNTDKEKGHYDGMPLITSQCGDKILYIPYLGVI